MILHPAALALLTMSLLVSIMVLMAGCSGVRILSSWDIRSGSELQLNLERRTYLISTILSYIFVFQVLSLFLYIYTADNLHVLFVGAMCAAGTLKVNAYGYPVLVLKVLNFLLAGTWLILNHADTRGYDYPLIKPKYVMLLFLTPLVLLEAYFQFRYFAGLHPHVITSCCGSLFSRNSGTIAGDIAALPVRPTAVAFYAAMSATLSSGSYFYLKGRGGWLFSASSVVTFFVAAASSISFICLYIYELPSHHCPFCVLQKEYGHVGYVLYAALLGGAVFGMGTGTLMPWRDHGSMIRVIPPLQRRLTAITLVLYFLFTLIATYWIVSSSFRLGER
jgi:hypothetical protein